MCDVIVAFISRIYDVDRSKMLIHLLVLTLDASQSQPRESQRKQFNSFEFVLDVMVLKKLLVRNLLLYIVYYLRRTRLNRRN